MEEFKARYKGLIDEAGIMESELPEDLQKLIKRFEWALEAANTAKGNDRYILFDLLAKTDAAISADIYSLFKERIEAGKLNKSKLLALKAKALKLKWNTQNN